MFEMSLAQDAVEQGTSAREMQHARTNFVGCISPGDHSILEAEYQRNPKPDKIARIDIVNRVALGEKEVQVDNTPHLRSSARCNIRYAHDPLLVLRDLSTKSKC